MEELLQKLLVVDPNKRMNHQEFFDFVQHLASPFITVFHIGPGKQGNVETESFDKYSTLLKDCIQYMTVIREVGCLLLLQLNHTVFSSCRDLCKLVAKKFGMHLEGTVAIVESSEEVVQFNSEALPSTLKDKVHLEQHCVLWSCLLILVYPGLFMQSVLFVIDEQSLESQQVPAFSSVALDHLSEEHTCILVP